MNFNKQLNLLQFLRNVCGTVSWLVNILENLSNATVRGHCHIPEHLIPDQPTMTWCPHPAEQTTLSGS